MAGQQRKCANCRFFSDAGMPGNGWCTHPKRQLNSGVKLLVRGGELACRNSWGGDLFQSRLEDEPIAASADLPGAGRDDEVTSVTIPSSSPTIGEDRVLADRPAARRPSPDINDPAHRDQAERARIMARGSHDALAHARRRLSSRQQGGSASDVVAGDNEDHAEADRIVTRQARFTDRSYSSSDAPRMRAEPVPREEVAQRGITPPDRFETVPEVDPTFDMSAQDAPPEPITDRAPEPEPEEPPAEEHLTAYEHVLQRARRIRAAKQQRMRPIRHADLLLGAVEAGSAHHDVAPAAQAEPTWVDAEAYHEDDFAAPDPDLSFNPEPAYEDDAEELTAESWQDTDWEDDWDEAEDVPVRPEPRRHGWLNRLGFGHRSTALGHDDATVTRHAERQHTYLDDEPDDDLLPAWDRSRREPAVRWPEAGDDHPARPAAREQIAVEEPPAPVPAPRREPEPDEWHAMSEPARPATPARQRPRLSTELPDLDDALFDEPTDAPTRREPSRWTQGARVATQATPSRAATDLLESQSPRDSYFRASRFQQEPAPTRDDAMRAPTASSTAPLDDIELPDLQGEQLDIRDVVARGNQLMDRQVAVAPDIPRMCRTCRSFRSADGGTRGWCTNEWAFTHRRMVNDDDLACLSAIGCWWLPDDRYRLDLDDEIDRAPTPRMDELIARNRPAARRVAGE